MFMVHEHSNHYKTIEAEVYNIKVLSELKVNKN